jgi:CHAT domain-containing protein
VDDTGELQRFIGDLYEIRQVGGLTSERVNALHQEAQQLTYGALLDASRCEPPLRDLRRMVFTLAFDAGLWTMAEALLEFACPPDLRDPPDLKYAMASADERIKWRSGQAMLLDAIGEPDRAREAFMRLGEDYLAMELPDEPRFALLTNAVQSAYELGDYAIGESLLLRAELLARSWSSDAIRLNLVLARLHPPVSACDVRQFRERYVEAVGVAETVAPALVPQLARFAVLAGLQMGMPEAAAEWLPASPPGSAPDSELLVDTLVRLQVQCAIGQLDESLVDRGLNLLGREASRSQETPLIGALAIALFHLGRTGPAVLMATLFVRDLDDMIATLPRNPQVARQRRANTLLALKPLQHSLVLGGYLRAAEEIAAAEAILRHGGSLPQGRYRQWAPGKRVRQAAISLLEVIRKAREGALPSSKIATAVMRFVMASPPPLLAEQGERQLNLSFLEADGKLFLVDQTPDGERRVKIALSSERLAELVQNMHRALRTGLVAETERRILGDALFGPIASRVVEAKALHIAAFGPVANLPFACLYLDGDLLCEGRCLTIRTCVTNVPETGPAAGARLKILFASGDGLDRLTHVSGEASAIAALYGLSDKAVEADFDKETLTATLMNPPEILHLAGHVHMPDDDRDGGVLIEAGGEKISLSDAFAPSVDLTSTRMVFLSGCDSAGHGGGHSLAAQINALGARHVIATLWPVDDAASAEMAKRVHQGIVRGIAPDLALSDALHALRSIPAFTHPRHWAAFQCYQA